MRILFSILVITSVWIFHPKIASSQNQVPNGSFEESVGCPLNNSHQKYRFCKDWWQATVGTPDYYTSCNQRNYSVPSNVNGYCEPLSGSCYSGLLLYSVYDNNQEYREYLETKLINPLKRGEKYVFFFYVKPAYKKNDNTYFFCNSIGIYLSTEQIVADSFGVLNFKPQITNQFKMMSDTANWQKICGEYIAKGGEQYLVIGNFKTNAETQTKVIIENPNKLSGVDLRSAYYYIDNVNLISTNNLRDEDGELKPFNDLSNISLWRGRKLPLKNVLFPFAKTTLTKTSIKELDKLVDLMNLNRRIGIKVIGNTDSIGNTDYNNDLSIKRAEAVRDYLIERGISEKRISIDAKGETCPIKDNSNEQRRRVNRRVEIVVTRC